MAAEVSVTMTPELANLVCLARRIVATPDGQHLLLLDRLNDLDIALWEYDKSLSLHAVHGSSESAGTCVGPREVPAPSAPRLAVTARGLHPDWFEDEEGWVIASLSYENREGDPTLNGAFDKW